MEAWQKLFIQKNSVALIQCTEVKETVLKALIAKDHLTKLEYQQLKRLFDRDGETQQASQLYNILEGRINSYNDLMKILEKEKQSESLEILNKGQKLYQLIESTVKTRANLEALGKKNILSKSQLNDLIKRLDTDTLKIRAEGLYKLFYDKLAPPEIDYLIDILEAESSADAEHTGEFEQNRQNSEGSAENRTLANFEPVPTGSMEPDDPDLDYKEYTDKAITKPLVVKVESPIIPMTDQFGKKDHYKLPSKGKGYALIINIITFIEMKDGKEVRRHVRGGAELDGEYMRELWKHLGYEIFKENEMDWNEGIYNEADIKNLLEEFRTVCDIIEPKSIVVYIGSHGKQNKIVSSDGQKLNLYQDIVLNFYHDLEKINASKIYKKFKLKGCPGLQGKPKIFLINACQSFEPEQSDDVLEPAVNDLIVCTSQVPGFKSWRNSTKGSWFTHCLTYVFMKYAREKSLHEMLVMVTSYLQKVDSSSKTIRNSEGILVPMPHGQIPELRISGLKELYFFM